MDLRPSEPRQLLWLALLLAALTFAAYWPVRHHDFINYDDQDYVTQNREVRQGLTWEGVRWAFSSSHSANWHPLTWLSHMLDCQLFGLRPAGHHLTSLGLHLANTVILFLVLQRATGSSGRSAFVAGLFAVHPLHVESVAWVAERKDVLSTFFGLLSLGAYLRYAKPGGAFHETRPAVFYALSVVLFALSLMSKAMLVTFPFLLLLLDFWPLGRLVWAKRSSWDSRLLEKLPFLALSLLVCAITLRVQHPAMSYQQHLPFAPRVDNALVSCVRYLAKAMWPHDLAVFYPHPGAWPATYVLSASALLLVISASAVLNWRRRPYLVVGWLWFCGTLVPVLGLVQVGAQSIADRYTYVPLIGLFIIAAWLGAEVLSKLNVSSRWSRSVAIVILLTAGLGTRAQLVHWRSTKDIFKHAIAATPDNWVAHYNLALMALSRYQDNQRSGLQQQLVTAYAAPNSTASAGLDDLQEVIDHCEATLRAKPGFPDPYVTLAKALSERGQLDAARRQLEIAIKLDPKNPEARQDLAEILSRQGQAREAVEAYRAALNLRADWDGVMNNLAWLLATCPDASVRDGQEAVRLAERACDLTGKTNLWFLHTLAAAYAEAGEFTNAVAAATEAQRLAAATGKPELAATAATRLELYRAHRALRAP